MLREKVFHLRNLLAVLLKDWRRYRVALDARNASYLALCNRNERLEAAPEGGAYRCDWQWTSDLHAPKYLPVLGKNLMQRALADHPIDRAASMENASSQPDVSFVIGHRGMERLPHLLATLESIAGQRDANVECIVVEQDSQPHIAAYLPAWVRHVHTPPPSPEMPYCRSWTFNIGARHCRGEVLILHDNDMLVPVDYAERVLKQVRLGSELVNLKRFIFYLSEQHTTAIFAGKAGLFDQAPLAIVQNLEGGGSVAITREAYERIGGMDESFVGWGGEDNEFWERAQTLHVWPYADLPIVHLWHAAQPGKHQSDNSTAKQYQALSALPAQTRIERLKAIANGSMDGPAAWTSAILPPVAGKVAKPKLAQTSVPATTDRRIMFLDGLRGVAIFWVLLFHAFVRWPETVPFGDRFSGVPYVAYGWLGVQLFFLISGFVIFMTLEKSHGFRDFISRRWLRLFPAMLLCSLLIFVTAPLFHERPAGAVEMRDLLPGLTFIDPTWWNLVFDSPQGVLEGAFWSLFVEMKFYLVAGFLFFVIGGTRMIAALVGLFVLAQAARILALGNPELAVHWSAQLMDLLSAKYFGWFAAGALYYRYFHERHGYFLFLAIVVALASALTQDGYQYRPELFALSVVVLFTAAIMSDLVKRLLTNRAFLFFGYISYPLYLLHENMMVSAIAKVGAAAPWLPAFLMPVLPILLVSGLAWLVAAYAEPLLREKLRPWVRKPALRIQELPNT